MCVAEDLSHYKDPTNNHGRVIEIEGNRGEEDGGRTRRKEEQNLKEEKKIGSRTLKHHEL